MKMLALVALAVAISTAPMAQEAYQPPEQAAIRAYLARSAFDPDAVKIAEITPARRITWGRLPKRTEVVSCVTWNGKNRYGAYVGFKTDAFVLNSTATEVVEVIDNGEVLVAVFIMNLCTQP